MGNTAGIEATEDDVTPAPTPEDRVGPPISWGSGPLSPLVTPFIEGAESGTGEGAVNEGKLVPKLPDNDKVFKYDKTVSLMTESSLTGGSLIWDTEEGLDATAGEVVTGVLRLLRLPAKVTLCLRYADILSRDQVLHSEQRFSIEQTIPRHDSHMVCKSNCKPLILRRHFGQERRAAGSTAAVAEAEVVEGVVESMFQVIAKSQLIKYPSNPTKGGKPPRYGGGEVRSTHVADN